MRVNQVLLIIFTVFSFTAVSQTVEELNEVIQYTAELSKSYPDSAIYILDSIESKVLESKDHSLNANICRRKANCYFFKGEYDMAIELYNKALKIRQSPSMSQKDSANLSEIGVLYHNISLSNEYLLNYPAAIDYAKKLEPIYTEIKDFQQLAYRCYNHVAKIYYYLGDFENAMNYSLKEIETASMINDSLNLSYAYDFQAVLCQDLGRLDDALDLQEESLNIRYDLGDSLLISYSYNNSGATLLLKEDYEKALESFKKSLDLKLRNNYGGVAATYNNLGLAYQKLGDLEKSESFYNKSYQYCLEREDPFGIAIAAVNLGVIYHMLDNPVKADKYFVEAYNIGIENGFKKTVVEATEYAHSFYYDQHRYKDAYDMLLQNQIYKDSIENDDVIKEIARLEAEHIYSQKQIADSIVYQHEKIRNEEVHKEAIKRKEQSIWILAITSIFIIFIIVILFKAYQLKKKSQEDELKQKALEIEKNLLRSQMNPHFIFNAMNSIQSFIAENDSYSALRYLSKFAKLIRLILENSMHKTILLCDEVLSLELYLELEKVRFDNKFDFEINIEDSIEVELVAVPPMLIQPFVENAIIHGIMHKKSKGCIKVHISEYENVLKCVVEDNGIGRTAAYSLKKEHGKKHKSVGMQLTRDRLESLNRQTQPSMSYTIDDVINEKFEVVGTKVEIYIPFSEI